MTTWWRSASTRVTSRPVADSRVGIFKTMAGEYADDGVALLEQAFRLFLDDAGEAGRRSRFAESAFGRGDQLVGADDLVVGHGVDQSSGIVSRRQGLVAAGRVADADGGGDGLRILDRVTEHQRRRSGCLEADHLRQVLNQAGFCIR